MPKNDEMTINERRKYLRIKQREYCAGSRNQKSAILTEMESVTKLDRKTLIRSMHSDLERQVRKKQRGRSYGPDVVHALRVISEAVDNICAERLLRLREPTNPRRLRDEIHRLIKLLVALPCAMRNESENIYETLRTAMTTHQQEAAWPR